MTGSWTVRQATAADIEACVDLRNEVYGSHVSPAEWRWKYFDNPAGGAYLFVAEDGGRIIGHVGRARARINVSGEPVAMAHSQDGFVRPAYRRQGVMAALLPENDAAAAADSIPALLGLGTPAGTATALKLGYHTRGNMVRLWMVLNPGAMVQKRTGSSLLAAISEPPLRLLLHLWAGRKRRPRKAGDITVEIVGSFDGRFDELWSSIKDGLPLGLWHDAAYLNWRYRACPVAQYTVFAARREESLLGFIVLEWGDEAAERYRVGKIVNFLFAPQELDAAPALIWAAADYFEDGGADLVACDIFGRGPFQRLLRSCGFFRRGQGLIFSVTLRRPGLPHHLLANRASWYFMENLT